MEASSTILSCNYSSSVLGIKQSKGSHHSSSFLPLLQAGISKKKAGYKFSRYEGLECQRSSWARAPNQRRSKLDVFAVCCNAEPESFLHFLPPINSWITWVLGLVAILPLVTQRLLILTKEVDATAEKVEKVADTVEKVAEDVEKVAEEIAEKFPEGGKLRNAIAVVENIAKETAKDAQLVEDFMDKVEEVDDEIERVIKSGSGDEG